MKIAISYARFSDRPDSATSKSNEAQHADNRQYCQSRGYEIELPEESDAAVSGKDKSEPVDAMETIGKRPGLLRAITRCKKDYILIVSFRDRIARDLYVQTAVERWLARQGAILESVNELNGRDVGAKMARAVLAVMAEEKRAEVSLRTTIMMNQHQKDGRRMGRADRLPYGFRADVDSAPNKRGKPALMVPDEEEMRIVEIVCQLATEGLGVRAICTRLDKAQFTRRGKPWKGGESTVAAILQRYGSMT